MEDYSRKATATKPMKDAELGYNLFRNRKSVLFLSGLVFLGPIFPSKSVPEIYLSLR